MDKKITLNKNITTGFLSNNILIKPNNDIHHTNRLYNNNLSLDQIKELLIKQLAKEDFDVSDIRDLYSPGMGRHMRGDFCIGPDQAGT